MADKHSGARAGGVNDEDVDDSIWDSPVKPTQKSKEQPFKSAQPSKPSHEDQEAREQALRQELASVRKVNETIEGVIENLKKAKQNMGVGSTLYLGVIADPCRLSIRPLVPHLRC